METREESADRKVQLEQLEQAAAQLELVLLSDRSELGIFLAHQVRAAYNIAKLFWNRP